MNSASFFTRLATLNATGPNATVEPDAAAEVFVCSMCDEAHDDYDDARDCCKPDVHTRYRCSVCRDLYRTESQAEACHPVPPSGAQPMQCPICLASAETFQIAADCHLHTHPTMTAWGRSQVADDVASGMPWAEAIAAHAEH